MPPLEQGDTVDVFDIKLEAKQTEPPARYSQGKLVQEMEKRGLGTKSTRASIIERLYAVRYLKNDPVEPSPARHSHHRCTDAVCPAHHEPRYDQRGSMAT